MIEINDDNKLIELVLNKHSRFLEIYTSEMKEGSIAIENIRNQIDQLIKEKESIDNKITVLSEKYHLLYHQAKKQREKLFGQLSSEIKSKKDIDAFQRFERLEKEFRQREQKLQDPLNIEDELRIAGEIKELLIELINIAGAGSEIIAGINESLSRAMESHKELLELKTSPGGYNEKIEILKKQLNDQEERFKWLEHRIESHNNASTYWGRQSNGSNSITK